MAPPRPVSTIVAADVSSYSSSSSLSCMPWVCVTPPYKSAASDHLWFCHTGGTDQQISTGLLCSMHLPSATCLFLVQVFPLCSCHVLPMHCLHVVAGVLSVTSPHRTSYMKAAGLCMCVHNKLAARRVVDQAVNVSQGRSGSKVGSQRYDCQI